MSEQKNIVHKETTTEEKMKELFDLMDEKAAAGELNEIEEEPAKTEGEAPAQEEDPEEDRPMSASERAGYEYAMMMKQYEAMLEDYMRRDAEEKAAAKKAKEEAEGK